MSGLHTNRIAKTIKMYIGGQFPRTESGRSFPVSVHDSDQVYAHVCKGSRKDIRQAVEVANKAVEGWSGKSAFSRSQILYRMAEMCEGKRAEMLEILTLTQGLTEKTATEVIDRSIDAFVYYAGFADKYAQVTASINPVSGPYHNFTAPDPVGVVGIISDSEISFDRLIATLSAAICSGNAVVLVLDPVNSVMTAALGEVFATSDLPSGVINLVSSDDIHELYSHLGAHMEVHSLTYLGAEKKIMDELKVLAIENMKRVIPARNEHLGLSNITDFVEYKTVWHPIGL